MRTVGHLTFDPAAVAALCRRHGVQELALFGSVLRSDFSPASDIDVLVTYRPEQGFIPQFTIFDRQFALEDLFGRPVDLVPADSLHPLIAPDVLRRKQVIDAAPFPTPLPDADARRVTPH
jgi:predicted nucleotidyltransferase